jgi:putative ATP-dependent endonuclease of the OLD family
VTLAPPSEDEQTTDHPNEDQQTKRPAVKLPPFFLHSLHVQNFRALEDAEFFFQPGLNVIIGANNAAKTAAIDALRFIFSLGTYERKDLMRLRPTDVFVDGAVAAGPQSITFTATFYGKNDNVVPAQFYDLLCPDELVTPGESGDKYVMFKLRYRADFAYNDVKGSYAYVQRDVRGGPSLSNPVSLDALDKIQAIYLAPLRDLVNDKLRVGGEIERLIVSHTPKEKEAARKAIPKTLADRAKELIKDVTQDNKHHAAAGENLARYARPYRIDQDSLSFEPDGISDELFSKMIPVFAHSLHGAGGLPLRSNGLGINQLIYASIVLSRRGGTDVDDHLHRFFLIEEPEAHLHPQLQDSFFHALNQITDHQLFVTSHSPTITAKTDLDKIIVMRRDDANRSARPLHLANAFEGRDDDKKYLHKFMDVTRSQLLFARGAVFVEGVTEAMLIQRFSEIAGYNLRDEAIEVVVVDSDEGYDHFRPLFIEGGAYGRAVFITDGDEDADDVPNDDDLIGAPAGRHDTGLQISADKCIATATGYGTFELGLLLAAIADGGNAAMQRLLSKAMEQAAPSSVHGDDRAKFAQDFLDFERPSLAYKRMKERKEGQRLQKTKNDWHATWYTNGYFKKAKSNFAFYLSEALADDQAAQGFTVPKYIRDAIMFVVRGTADSEDPGCGTDI